MILLFIFLIVVLVGSISLLIWGDGDDHPYHNSSWNSILTFVTFIGLLVIIPMQAGQVARYEISPIPWAVYEQAMAKHGTADAWLSVIANLIFLLWIYVIPGRLYALKLARQGNLVQWPYVVNFLVGLLLSTPYNPIYKILGIFVT